MILLKDFMGTRPKEADDEKNPSLMLKMVTSYSIFLLVIFIMAVILYTASLQNIRSRQEAQNLSLLESSIQLFEKDINIMDVFCRQLLQDRSFNRLALSASEASNNFRIRGFGVKETLSANIYPDYLLPINEYYIYLTNSKYIISPSYFGKGAIYYKGKNPSDDDMLENWITVHESGEFFNTFLPLGMYSRDSGQDYYMYLLDMSSLIPYRDIPAVANFIISRDKLATRFMGIDYREGCIVAVSAEGKEQFCLYDFKESAPAYDVDTLSSLKYDGHLASYNNGDRQMVVTKAESGLNGWQFYLLQPPSTLTLGTQKYHIFFIASMVVALALGGYMVLLFSRRNVRPIIKLGRELQDAKEVQSQLQEVVDKQKPIILGSYVRQLMLGTVSSEQEAEYITEYMGLSEKHLHYNVLYVVAYNNAVDSQDGLPSGIGSVEDFNTVMTETMKKHLHDPLYCYIPEERTYAVLLTFDVSEEDSFIMTIQDFVIKLHEHLLDTYSIWMFAGIGRSTDRLINIWESYQQAVEAVSYTSKNYIFFPYEFIKKDSNVFYYPPELSAKLIHFITTGNTAQVLELFSLIHKENIQERSLPVNLLKFLMSDIRNSLLRARFALPSGTDKDTAALLDEMFNGHLSFKLCEDIAMTLCRLFTVESEDSSLAATIEKYIQTNFRDPSLCLNKISDEFQISESYFSHMFKEKTGVNFSVYLENIRMSEAVRLVRETDTNLSELYIAVGYNNPSTFRRAFKKTFGVVPSSMREAAQTTH